MHGTRRAAYHVDDVAAADDLLGTAPERLEDRDGLGRARAQPGERRENLAGPSDLEETGGPAALA